MKFFLEITHYSLKGRLRRPIASPCQGGRLASLAQLLNVAPSLAYLVYVARFARKGDITGMRFALSEAMEATEVKNEQ